MLKPTYKIEYNEKNITKDVSAYVLSLEYSDYEHGQSDEITITFEDTQKLWQNAWIPSKGDTLRVFIGYENEKLLNCGLFEIDEIEYDSPPDTLTVKALASAITKPLREENSKGYENKTLKQIAQEIAQKHNLALIGEIDGIKIERITQNQESDLAFLKRIAEEYGYIFKIADNNLVFYKTSKLINEKTAKIIYKNELTCINLREKTSKLYKAVSVTYKNPKTGKIVSAVVRNENCIKGDTLKLDLRCENKEQAILKAKAALDKGNNTIEGSIQIVGTPYLAAGINIELKDIGYFSGKYHVKEAKQTINKYSGYTTNLEIASC